MNIKETSDFENLKKMIDIKQRGLKELKQELEQLQPNLNDIMYGHLYYCFEKLERQVTDYLDTIKVEDDRE